MTRSPPSKIFTWHFAISKRVADAELKVQMSNVDTTTANFLCQGLPRLIRGTIVTDNDIHHFQIAVKIVAMKSYSTLPLSFHYSDQIAQKFLVTSTTFQVNIHLQRFAYIITHSKTAQRYLRLFGMRCNVTFVSTTS